jgi:hypothetical protein
MFKIHPAIERKLLYSSDLYYYMFYNIKTPMNVFYINVCFCLFLHRHSKE